MPSRPTGSPDRLSADDRAKVAAYWWRRAQGEITSWVGFRHVRDDLVAEGSPAAVVALAGRAVEDEYAHAQFCREWAMRFGHSGGALEPRGEEPARFVGASDAENRLLRIGLCCLTETVGCFMLQGVRPAIRDGELRRLNQRHMSDELRHSRVGWGHLSTLDAERKRILGAWMPKLLALLPRICVDGPEDDREDLVPFGYFTPRLLKSAHDQAVEEVILPGFEQLGIATGGLA